MSQFTFGPQGQGLQAGEVHGSVHIHHHHSPAQPDTPQPSAWIPVPRNQDFVNRGDILDQLHQRCAKPAARVAIVGLGGMGKSQLATEFAHQVADSQPSAWVFWVHAATPARVEQGFRDIATIVKLQGLDQPEADILPLVYNWLSNEQNGRWIMILDSADDRDVFYGSSRGGPGGRPLAAYLPPSRNGSIVLTTRNGYLANELTGHHRNLINVGPMAPDDAVMLLKRRLEQPLETGVATQLVGALDLIPLAISQAAAYIHRMGPRYSPKKYLDEFRKSEGKKVKLLEHNAGILQTALREDGKASNAVLKTWQITFDHIRSLRPSAAHLLSLMSFFDRQGIPESLLKAPYMHNAEGVMQDRGLHGSSGTESDSGDGETDDEFEEDVATLRDFYLVTVGEDGDLFEMHRLVQLSTKLWLKGQKSQECFMHQFLARLAASFPTDSSDFNNWATCQRLFAHVESAMNCRPAKSKVEETWATLLSEAGAYAMSQDRYDVAERMLQKATNSRKERLGEEHQATLFTTGILARALWYQGRYKDAEALQVQVLESHKREQGQNHCDTLTSIDDLAITFQDQGRFGEAEQLHAEALEARKAQLGPDHPHTMWSMNNLAVIYQKQGRLGEAEQLHTQALEARKRQLGPDHHQTISSMNNLSAIYQDQGRLEEAEQLQIQALQARKRQLGPTHPHTITSMNNLTIIYYKQGRLAEAEQLHTQALEARKTQLGADHPDTLWSISYLAIIYQKQGRLAEAEQLQIQALEARKTQLGPDHPYTLTSLNNLAIIYYNQGRLGDAEQLQTQALEGRKTQLGAEHPVTLWSITCLANIYQKQGRLAEAEQLQIQALEARKRQLGPDHPDTLTGMHNLALTWKDQGRHQDALALMKDCVRAWQRVFGPEHPCTQGSLNVVEAWSR